MLDRLFNKALSLSINGEEISFHTLAEFEFALRAGTTTAYWWGDGHPTRVVGNLTGEGDRSRSKRTWAKAFANYRDGYWGPAPVARFEANGFGLYDLGSNVSEWTEDCWHQNFLRAPEDGSAWVNRGCVKRVVRGGSWGRRSLGCRGGGAKRLLLGRFGAAARGWGPGARGWGECTQGPRACITSPSLATLSDVAP